MAASGYNPVFPSGLAAEDRIRSFVPEFFQISDDPTQNEKWLSNFLPDAVLVMGPSTAKGIDEIRQVRQKMWEKVATRKHYPQKVFQGSFGSEPSGDGSKEYVVLGELDYELKTGDKQHVSWTGHMVTKEVEGQLKFQFYRVYIQL